MRTIVTLAFLTLTLTGCAQTPLQRWEITAKLYTTTVNTLTEARRAGLISDAQAREIEPIRRAASTAIDGMRASAERRDLEAYTSYYEAASLAIEQLITYLGKRKEPQSHDSSPNPINHSYGGNGHRRVVDHHPSSHRRWQARAYA